MSLKMSWDNHLTYYHHDVLFGLVTNNDGCNVSQAFSSHAMVKGMHSLLQQIFSQSSLLSAWNEISSQPRRDGKWLKEMEDFQVSAPKRILEIHTAFLSGNWHPSPVRVSRIPKEGGGSRMLGIPPIGDRVVERSTLQAVDSIVDAHLLPWSFAYRRGLGVNDAINALIESRDDGATMVLRCDIHDCFATIPHGGLLREISSIFPDLEMQDYFKMFIKRGVARGPMNKPTMSRRGIHQGSPLSPMFANLFLNALDSALVHQGFPIIRYSDDIAVPVHSKSQAKDSLQLIEDFLAINKMKLSQKKISIDSFEDGVRFLGQSINSRSLVDNSAHPKRVSLYISEQGSLLRSKGNRIRVELPDKSTFSIGYERLNNVIIFGRVGMTTPVMQQLVRQGIDLTLLSQTGGYFGRLEGLNSGNPFLRAAQYQRARSPQKRLAISKIIVEAKISNQRVLAMKYLRRYELHNAPSIIRLQSLRKRIHDAENLQSLMGFEGISARDYFQTLRVLVGPEWNFEARRRRPPPDPVNSMLSFGYSLLTQEVISAVTSAGLDPYMGYLHHPRIGRPSLALDLVEEFRAPIVDSLVMKLILTKAITPGDFSLTENEPITCLLLPESRKKFIAAYERRMLTMFTHVPSGRKVTWRQALGIQSRQFAQSLLKHDDEYTPVVWK